MKLIFDENEVMKSQSFDKLFHANLFPFSGLKKKIEFKIKKNKVEFQLGL